VPPETEIAATRDDSTRIPSQHYLRCASLEGGGSSARSIAARQAASASLRVEYLTGGLGLRASSGVEAIAQTH